MYPVSDSVAIDEVPDVTSPRFPSAGFADSDTDPVDHGSDAPQTFELEPGELSTSEEMHLDNDMANAEAAILQAMGKGDVSVEMSRKRTSWGAAPETEYFIVVMPQYCKSFYCRRPTLSETVGDALRELDLRRREAAGCRCPKCGGGEIIRITPMTPGPNGWGSRCKACGHDWPLVIDDAESKAMDALNVCETDA